MNNKSNNTLAGGAARLAEQIQGFYPGDLAASSAPKLVKSVLCNNCDDTGFYVPNMAIGERGFGRGLRCHCGGPKRSPVELADVNGVLHIDATYSLDYYTGRPGKAPAALAIKTALELGCKFIYLYGRYGMGKTGMLVSAINAGCEMGHRSVYSDMPKIMQYERERFGNHDDDTEAKHEEGRRLALLAHAKVLAIDEIDKAAASDYIKEKFFTLLNDRYNRRHDRLTILASNTAPNRLPPHLNWLKDRFKDALVFNVQGENLRGPQNDKR